MNVLHSAGLAEAKGAADTSEGESEQAQAYLRVVHGIADGLKAELLGDAHLQSPSFSLGSKL